MLFNDSKLQIQILDLFVDEQNHESKHLAIILPSLEWEKL